MFGLSDPTIINALNEKSKNVKVKVFCDKGAKPPFNSPVKFSTVNTGSGLMHQKILAVDDEFVFLGSANLTRDSLHMHNNLMIGLHSQALSDFLKKNSP